MESQLLMDNQIDHHDVLITEREEGIREIQGQIAEVGEIFQDLAVLVNEQGDMVNDIESNIISTHGHTDHARKELVKAASHQKSARNRVSQSTHMNTHTHTHTFILFVQRKTKLHLLFSWVVVFFVYRCVCSLSYLLYL